ncbi:MAG: hypothetical protein DRP06_00880 [Candidatus Aenigmatarchaeota archaeon]|nr:MAG: hypothetical protein DRP06_00880 [Candidatus Aenigmarchaeota archaeon]
MIINILKSNTQYLSATKKVLDLGPVSEERRDDLERMDALYGFGYYAYNLEFVPVFQRDIYDLKEDLENLWSSQIKMAKSTTPHLSTKFDYFGNVIMPLVENIQQPAQNPENDIPGKLPKKNYGNFGVYSEVDEKNREIIIDVRDIDFGIKQEIQDKLFQKGVSTKTDKYSELGIGLWAAKNFVEENGGRIWFETEPGKGTSVKFTIPYKEKKQFHL